MSKKKNQSRLSHKKFFSLLFFCITLLVYSTCFMIENGGITFDSVTGAFVNIIPYCLAVGALGYVIGAIIDKPKKIKQKYDKDMMDKLVKDFAPNETEVESGDASLPPVLDELNIKVDTEADL